MNMPPPQRNDFPPALIEQARRRIGAFGRIGATRIYRVPPLPAVLAPGDQSSQIPVRFRVDGVVLAMYGQESESATNASAAQASARIQISGSEDLFTDGQSGAFVNFLALFGPTQNWFPIERRVYTGQDWTTTYQNEGVAGDINPQIFFAVLEDPPAVNR